jgi:hypothetical protein
MCPSLQQGKALNGQTEVRCSPLQIHFLSVHDNLPFPTPCSEMRARCCSELFDPLRLLYPIQWVGGGLHGGRFRCTGTELSSHIRVARSCANQAQKTQVHELFVKVVR